MSINQCLAHQAVIEFIVPAKVHIRRTTVHTREIGRYRSIVFVGVVEGLPQLQHGPVINVAYINLEDLCQNIDMVVASDRRGVPESSGGVSLSSSDELHAPSAMLAARTVRSGVDRRLDAQYFFIGLVLCQDRCIIPQRHSGKLRCINFFVI